VQAPRLYALAGLIGVGSGFMSEVIQMPLRATRRGKTCSPTRWACCWRWRCTRCSTALGVRGRRALAALLIVAGCTRHYVAPIVSMARAYCIANGSSRCSRVSVAAELSGSSATASKREIRDGALDVEFDARHFPASRSTSRCPTGAVPGAGHRRARIPDAVR
jgi:hypothetical protein